ncbi:MAG: CBS domain-containing protein [Saprospiraceae bacterium]|nr:CBS domain-containing protein [Saprospiraceae bacterium]
MTYNTMTKQVKDIMTREVICLNTEDIVTKVDEIFNAHNIHHIPILSVDDKVVGIISKTDFERISAGFSMFKMSKREEYNHALYRSLRAVEIMTRDVKTISAVSNVNDAIKIFKENRLHALPVIEDDSIVGIITPYDIMVYYAEHCHCT